MSRAGRIPNRARSSDHRSRARYRRSCASRLITRRRSAGSARTSANAAAKTRFLARRRCSTALDVYRKIGRQRLGPGATMAVAEALRSQHFRNQPRSGPRQSHTCRGLAISGQALRLLRSATLEQRHAGYVGLWNGLRHRCITAIAEATMAPKPHSLGLDPGNHQAPGSCFVADGPSWPDMPRLWHAPARAQKPYSL